MSDFSANLRRLRKKANLSQDFLAQQLGVSRQTVSSWECGKSYPDLDMLVQICDSLNVSPNEVLYPSENRGRFHTEEIINHIFFQRIAFIVFAVGFILGVSAGSQVYSPALNTAGWHFVFFDAFKYWGCSFLIGMLFIGISKILSLLYLIRETEQVGRE